MILCTLHAGGKFSGKAYARPRGGLHGVGVSVVNALSDRLAVEVARSRQLWRQDFSRGHPAGAAAGARAGAEPARHHGDLPPRCRDLRRRGAAEAGAAAADGAVEGLSLLRRRDPLALRARLPRAPGDDTPEQATFHFPGGLSDYLAERLEGAQCYADRAFAGKVDFAERFGAGTIGSVEWAVNWTPQRDAFVSSYCNTIHTPGGRHARAGLLGGDPEGHPRLRRARLEPQGDADHPRGRDGRRAGDDLGLHPRAGVRRPDQGPAGDAGGGAAGRGARCATASTTGWRRTPAPPARSSTTWC